MKPFWRKPKPKTLPPLEVHVHLDSKQLLREIQKQTAAYNARNGNRYRAPA